MLCWGRAGVQRRCRGAQTPVTGHYPPGQSGIRGASTPEPGVRVHELQPVLHEPGRRRRRRGAETSSTSCATRTSACSRGRRTGRFFGLRYGALAGVPFATGDLASPTAESGFGLGDMLFTPVSLYGKSAAFDYQFQFTVWTPSGHFSPGSARNRGTGFWALVYSLGGVYYPGGDREAWSVSAVARFEQNFEQRGSGIEPGDDVVVDWGVGRVFRVADRPLDVGVSGFGQWQLTAQEGGPPGTERAALSAARGRARSESAGRRAAHGSGSRSEGARGPRHRAREQPLDHFQLPVLRRRLRLEACGDSRERASARP